MPRQIGPHTVDSGPVEVVHAVECLFHGQGDVQESPHTSTSITSTIHPRRCKQAIAQDWCSDLNSLPFFLVSEKTHWFRKQRHVAKFSYLRVECMNIHM